MSVKLILSFLVFLMERKSIFACFKDQARDRAGWKTVDADFLTQQANTVGKKWEHLNLYLRVISKKA